MKKGNVTKILEVFDSLFNQMQEAVSLLEYRDEKYYYVQNNNTHQNFSGCRNIREAELSQVVGKKVYENMNGYLVQCIRQESSLVYEQEYTFGTYRYIGQTELIPIIEEDRKYILLISRDNSTVKWLRDKNKILTQQYSDSKRAFDTAKKEYRRYIEFLSYHDTLTGLYNRQYIEEINSWLNQPENLPIAVIMGDVNGLKITNDAFGYKSGDELLKSVAELLQENCKPDALITRWGGDEFVAFLPQTSLNEAEKITRQISKTSISVKENGLRWSLSLGCSIKDSQEESITDILREAEEAMYRHKLLNGKGYRNAIINTLLVTLYENSNETKEHSERIGEHCHLIGRELGISSMKMAELSLLAMLHDIGKVGIDSSILKKTGALTAEEWVEMKRHPEIGYRIAQANPELAMIADLILSHHERWDGKGYPYGLKGKEIPLLCRILAVADSFDAMTNDRVYRKGMSKEDALKEIEKNSGTQFDPGIVGIFMSHVMK